MVNINQQLGRKIKQIREGQGLSQEEIAFRAKLDYSYFNQDENGRRNPSVGVLDRIAKALGVSIKDLFD